MVINIELSKVSLQQMPTFKYNVGDCLFDAMSYLLKYYKPSTSICGNGIYHL
jgi:hypothetical protein